MPPKILLVDNDEDFLQIFKELLEQEGFWVDCASGLAAAHTYLNQYYYALALIDYRLADEDDDGDASGLRLARSISEAFPTPRIMLTKFDRTDYAVNSLRTRWMGKPLAIDFILKQDGFEVMIEAVKAALKRASVFLCYAHPDQPAVLPLFDNLAAVGFKPWMDVKCILPGERWSLAIQKAIRTSDFFVACLSGNSVNRRGFIQREISWAIEQWEEKLQDDIFLIPSRLEECSVTDERLKKVQWVDLYQPAGFKNLVESIHEGLNRRS